MKILILVQSTELPVYADLIQTQMETWDSVNHPDIKVIYYRASSKHDILEDNILSILSRDSVENTFGLLMKSIRYLIQESWDYVIKTDNSVYINKSKLYELINTKSRNAYYAGVSLTTGLYRDGVKIEDQKYLWGECIVMSRDIALYLLDKFNKAPLKGRLSEDLVIGQILDSYCPWNSIDIKKFFSEEDLIDTDSYVYRVRTIEPSYAPIFGLPANIEEILKSDVRMMNKIHNTITNGQTNNNNILQEQTKDQA